MCAVGSAQGTTDCDKATARGAATGGFSILRGSEAASVSASTLFAVGAETNDFDSMGVVGGLSICDSKASELVALKPRIDGRGTESNLASVAGTLSAAATSTVIAADAGCSVQHHERAPLLAGAFWDGSAKYDNSATSMRRSRDGNRPSIGWPRGKRVRLAARNQALASRAVPGIAVLVGSSVSAAPLSDRLSQGGGENQLPEVGNV